MSINVPTNALTSRCPLLSINGALEFSTRVPIPTRVTPDDTYYVTQPNDSLPKLAYQFYGDVRLWWVLYDANAAVITCHPIDMPAGLTLRIPSEQTVETELLDVTNV